MCLWEKKIGFHTFLLILIKVRLYKCFSKKNQTKPRPSEHPSVMGEIIKVISSLVLIVVRNSSSFKNLPGTSKDGSRGVRQE